ncbi:MAG: hypothetical protein RIR26_1292 [Pseudomonadota bacterium]|jgi:hypothetical protein
MKVLFLFYTQAEGGAPGFLSRNGEEAAGHLAQTLFHFASESLQLPLEAELSQRLESLEGDIRWRAYKNQDSLPQAVKAASALYPDVLLFSGESTRSVKTAEPVAQICGLPVCVDARLDRASEDKPASGWLADAIEAVLRERFSELEKPPRSVWVATSQKALLEWTRQLMPAEKWSEFSDVFVKSCMGDTIPTVFACGYEKTAQGARWVVD